MKETQIQIREMNKENLKHYNNGKHNKVYEISVDNFNSYLEVFPDIPLERLMEVIEAYKDELE